MNMNKENTFKVIDREGKEIEFEILFTFESDETKNNYIVRIDDNTHIPNDIKNIDYLAYLEWLNAGNTPLPVDPKTQEELILEEKVSKIKEEKNEIIKNPETIDNIEKYIAIGIVAVIGIIGSTLLIRKSKEK